MYPQDLKYTPEHEWVRSTAPDGSETGTARVRVGITSFAQESLGDIVYVTLPEPGTQVSAGEPVGEVESTKSVSDVYAPLTGTIAARNDVLDATPELINSDPYGDGWMLDIDVADPDDVAALLDADAYERTVGEGAASNG